VGWQYLPNRFPPIASTGGFVCNFPVAPSGASNPAKTPQFPVKPAVCEASLPVSHQNSAPIWLRFGFVLAGHASGTSARADARPPRGSAQTNGRSQVPVFIIFLKCVWKSVETGGYLWKQVVASPALLRRPGAT